MSKQRFTAKEIFTWDMGKINSLTEKQAREAYRIAQQANNKRIKRIVADGKWSPAMKLNWGLRDDNTKTPQFKPQSVYKNELNIKGALGGIIAWANKETSTLAGTKKWEKKTEKSIGESIGQNISYAELENIFDVVERFREVFPEYQATATSVLIDFVYSEGVENINKYIREGHLTPYSKKTIEDISTQHQRHYVKMRGNYNEK